MLHRRCLILTIVLLQLCWIAFAQTNSTHFSGVVTDANGSVITGAQVSLKQNNRVLETTTTDDKGLFELKTEAGTGSLLEVASPGFETLIIKVNSQTSLPLKLTLTPQSLSADVTITATRTSTPLSETAASVVQLNSEKLDTTPATTLDDALRQVAGFSLFRRSGSRTANPTSQGVSLRATGGSGASRALVLADGVPLNDPFGGWVYWDRVPRESINQVEVLFGGASHLYGSSALGGVIDIGTKSTTSDGISISTSYGNQDSPNVSAFASGSTHGWSGSVAFEGFHTDGYILVPEDQRGVIDTKAGTENVTTNLRIERSLGGSGRLFGRAAFFGEARENGTPLQTNRTHVRQFVFGGDWSETSVGSIKFISYGGTQVYDQNFSAISSDRNSETITRLQRVPAQVFGITTQFSRTFARRQTIVGGFEGREVRGFSDEIVYTNGRATSFVGAGGRERAIGGYVEDLVRIGSRVWLNLGGRVDRWRNFAALSATRPVSAINPTSVTFFPDRSETAFSPHASIVYQVNDRVSVIASMSRAFRAPTLNELYRSFRVGNVLTLANENLQAERLTGGEAGLRLNSPGDKFSMRGSFFWNEITRPVANVTLTTTPTLITRQRQNLGRTRSRGVELQSEMQLNRNWDLSASYLFAHATVIEFPVNQVLEGLWIPQVPRHQFTFQTRYMNPRVFTVALQGRASSSQFDDDLNQFRLASYFTLDVLVSRRINEKVELFAAVENVFNQRYEVGKTPVTTLGPPILVRGGIRVRLGR